MRTILLAVLCSAIIAPSCKKEKNVVTATQDEFLGPENSKVLHYSFNNSVNDGSGNNFNAISSNEVTYVADRFNRANQAIYFTQSGTSTSNVITPGFTSQNLSFPFSVSLWFNADSIYNGECLLRSNGGESSSYHGFVFQFNPRIENDPSTTTLSFSFGNGGVPSPGSRNTIFGQENSFTTNQWYHAVVVVRGYNDMDMYINGSKISNTIYSGSANTISYSGGGTIGMYLGNGKYKGKMDDYRVYNKVLSQTEVSKLYNFTP